VSETRSGTLEGMPRSRWDRILELKPVPLIEHVMEEVARLFAADLRTWPPPVDEFEGEAGAKIAALLAANPRPPDDRVVGEAFTLTRFDLAHEHEAYDDYLRNQRWQEAGLTASDKPMLLFLSRFMSEQLLALGEATEGRLKRAQLLEVLARTQRHFLSKGRPQ